MERPTHCVGGGLVAQARSADAREREELLRRGSLGRVGAHDDNSVAAHCFGKKDVSEVTGGQRGIRKERRGAGK